VVPEPRPVMLELIEQGQLRGPTQTSGLPIEHSQLSSQLLLSSQSPEGGGGGTAA
jgi:hypothetical protein